MKNNSTNYVIYPVLDEIKADTVFPTLDEWNGETEMVSAKCIEQDSNDYFILKVTDNSMYPQFQEGDKVLVLKQDATNYSGQTAAVVYGNEAAMLRKVEYRKNEDRIRLVPTDVNSFPIEIQDRNAENFQILGIPKQLIRNL